MKYQTAIGLGLICGFTLLLAGCKSEAGKVDPPDGRDLSASDFVEQGGANPSPTRDSQGANDNGAANHVTGKINDSTEPDDPIDETVAGDILNQDRRVNSLKELGFETPVIEAMPTVSSDGAWVVDAMVGQVNNQAIYASRVFEPIEEVLRRRGQELPADEFRTKANELIGLRLTQMVLDKLILGEAERNLKEGERRAVEGIVEEYRAELLRQYGRGSASLASATLEEQTGKNLARTLSEHRQAVVVQRFLQMKLFPKIKVTKRRVRQYYDEDPENIYHPELTREIRLIRVDTERDRDAIVAGIKKAGFLDAAENPKNKNRPDQQGRFGKVTGDAPLPYEQVNQAIATLKEGEYSEALEVTLPNNQKEYWWVYVEQINVPEPVPFDSDVQVKITEKLRAERFQYLTTEYRRSLLEEGNYESMNKMMEQLMQVAFSRYYRPKE